MPEKDGDLLEKIIEAKKIIGDKAIPKIVEHYHVDTYDPVTKKACCPFHREDTPSFIWNEEQQFFKCFGCGRVVSLLDVYTDECGSYVKGVEKLCKEVGIEFNTSSVSFDRRDYFKTYRFPKPLETNDRSIVDGYCEKRGISKKTLDHAGVKQDVKGNVAFEFFDMDGTLLCRKYRLSHSASKGQPKMWWDKDADSCPVLFNLNKIDITKPVVVTEGMMDSLAVIQSGYTNVVSIPGGAEDSNWIEFNYEVIEKIPEFILWYDNDKAGQDGLKKAISRLGEYRCKIVTPEKEDEDAVEKWYKDYNENLCIRKTDANNVLLACGHKRVFALIDGAKEVPVENLIDLMTEEEFDIEKTGHISSGISELDKQIYGFIDGSLNIWTAYAGCVDCDTEFFNGKEWKRISEYDDDDMVLQYNMDGTAELVKPYKYHKYPCDTLWHFKTKYGLDQCLSDEHTVVYLNYNGKIATKEFSEVRRIHGENKTGFCGEFLRTFRYEGMGIPLSNAEIELMCAVICDGSFNKANSYRCRLHLKKDRKKQRIREILNECGLDYKENESAASGYTDFSFYPPRKEKEFSGFWYNCNQEQLRIICDNVLFWDGHTSSTKCGTIRRGFSTTLKTSADFVQFAFSACGYSATVSVNDRGGQKYFTCGKYYTRKSKEYTVTISERKTSSMKNIRKKIKIEKYTPIDGYKYCFTVPSHMWIMRRNGRIVVTGNCGKTTLISQTCVLEAIDRGESVFWFNAESTTSQMLNWILSQAAGRDHMIEFKKNDGFSFYKPTRQAVEQIKEFYKDKIFVYDNLLLSSANDVLDKMKYVYKRRGTKVFVLDNWLCLNFRGKSDAEVTGIQVDFMNDLIHFAKKNNLEIHLVAHPRKPQAAMPLTEYDILGSSNIVNMADRIYGLEKVWDDTLKNGGYDRQFTVFKDRILGVKGERIGLRYDRVTRRLYSDTDDRYRKYKWDNGSLKYDKNEFGENGLLVGRRMLDYEQQQQDALPM